MPDWPMGLTSMHGGGNRYAISYGTRLIDNGDDERLVLLAANILPMPFSSSLVDVDGHHQHASVVAMEMHGIHPAARLCVARGIAYNAT